MRSRRRAAAFTVLLILASLGASARAAETCLMFAASNIAKGGGNMYVYRTFSQQKVELKAGDVLVQRAEAFNHPLLSTPVFSNDDGVLSSEGSLLSLDADNVIVTGVKRAEDDNELVIRFYEAYGKPTKVTARLAAFETGEVTTVNFIEDKLADEKGLAVELRPHEIRTLRFCARPRTGGEARQPAAAGE